ncbi:MAG: ThiF family adenylyltransferase [Candidatus Nanohaloarchaea archaeon]
MYSRFKSLEDGGEAELESLRNSRAAVVGLGATGTVIAENLARHGVKLALIDRDFLEMNDCYSSNIYEPKHCEENLPKARAAEKKLGKFTEVESHVKSIRSSQDSVLHRADVIMDGTDNIETRRVINSVSKRKGIPWVYTATVGSRGCSAFFKDECFDCLVEEVSPGSVDTCESTGLMREVSGIAGLRSSLKAVRYLAGGSPDEKLDLVPGGESLKMDSDGCRVCEEKKSVEIPRTATSVCGENKYEINRKTDGKSIERLRESSDSFFENEYLARGETETGKITLFREGRAIVEAESRGQAEQLFSETVGV